MNKKCARCEKTVYPIEELKCLDKIWHKTCFKCKECGMALNMRNYKGFNKDPYCEAHIPKAKATTMADTPELKRIQENTKLQSNVKYHAEFEKAKGKFTQVADDPETLRIKQNSKIISNVAYHGDLEKKAVMEQKRVLTGENGDTPIVTAQPGRRIGSIADLDPVNDFYGSIATDYRSSNNNSNHNNNHAAASGYPQNRHQSSAPVHQQYPVQAPPQQYQPPPSRSGRVYRAMYDYEAQDRDEVSFRDGDMIVNCTPIDEGWMTGVVQRTGQSGMLPANYVEVAHL
ncbi:LIM and SH3 domain protein Lasp isoform X2 [Thrips palmi]|uniref:LIM and SH3 domain protein Lasp isoform X2 n=1 Tax=Thrips palmi TaxID=161013 RepID=A0A6P8Z1F7_THRPL|nr:LIM and SH3 domain protein Lasp isoform X2 [Thrips palmi]